jgi:hypothetical protein
MSYAAFGERRKGDWRASDHITVSIVTLGIVRGLDIWISTEECAGFLSGSLGSYLGSSGHSKNMFEMIGNTVRDAVVGGTISMIGVHRLHHIDVAIYFQVH